MVLLIKYDLKIALSILKCIYKSKDKRDIEYTKLLLQSQNIKLEELEDLFDIE